LNIQRALSELAEIRAQLDRTTSYQGFRSLATGFSALLAIVGGVLESTFVTDPQTQIDPYLAIWLGVAVASSLLAGSEMIIRGIVSRKLQVWVTHRKLVANLLPSLIVGSVLTLVIAEHALESSGAGMIWSLPGMWAMVFGLGIFSCRQDLPRATGWVSAYYLFAGIVCLLINSQTHQLAPLQMVLLFGVGQTALGFVLFWNVERKAVDVNALSNTLSQDANHGSQQNG
jgi:hypothetical protein